MTAYRYWGIRCSNTSIDTLNIGNDYLGIASFELREVALGTDRANGATALASVTYPSGDNLSDPTYVPAKAVDNNSSTFWTTGANPPHTSSYQHWFMVDLGAEYNITECIIRVRPDGVREDPREFTIFAATGMNPGLSVEEWDFTTGAWSAGEAKTFTLTNPDSPAAADTNAYQVGSYVICLQPAEDMNAYQVGAMNIQAAETENGFYDVNAYQVGAYVLCRPGRDRRERRAWRFVQDNHDFYVVQVREEGTLVFDRSTDAWFDWYNNGYDLWRGADGCAWEGYEVCCDTESGKVWWIDPNGRKDYGTESIISKVKGYYVQRFRENKPVYMAELAISENQVPEGIEAADVGITLRTSDDDGEVFTNHGELTGEDLNTTRTPRWFGLGLMAPPGRIFEVIDTGYARRIDGLDIDTGDNPGSGDG